MDNNSRLLLLDHNTGRLLLDHNSRLLVDIDRGPRGVILLGVRTWGRGLSNLQRLWSFSFSFRRISHLLGISRILRVWSCWCSSVVSSVSGGPRVIATIVCWGSTTHCWT